MATDHDDGPVARPEMAEGDLILISHDDAADLAAEAHAWLVEAEDITNDQADEISTMMYELLTGDYARTLNDE